MRVYHKARTKHIRQITLKGDSHNNNKMERINGEIRDREKTMRGLKSTDTAHPKGLPDIPQLHKTTRSTKRQNTLRSMRNNHRRKKQMENPNTKCQ